MCALVVPTEVVARIEEIWKDGYTNGYDDAEETLEGDSFFDGYEEGFKDGYDECQEELPSYEAAFEDGHTIGYDEGFSVAARGALEAATSVMADADAVLTSLDEECVCETCICLELAVLADWAGELQERLEAVELLLNIKFVG